MWDYEAMLRGSAIVNKKSLQRVSPHVERVLRRLLNLNIGGLGRCGSSIFAESDVTDGEGKA